MGTEMKGVNDVENWDWELYPAGWYGTFGFVGPRLAGWRRYLEVDRRVREEAGVITVEQLRNRNLRH